MIGVVVIFVSILGAGAAAESIDNAGESNAIGPADSPLADSQVDVVTTTEDRTELISTQADEEKPNTTARENTTDDSDDDEAVNTSTATGTTVYIGADNGNLYAVDAASGDVEWVFEQATKVLLTSPTVVDGTVYVGSLDHTLYAVDAVDGSLEWTYYTGDSSEDGISYSSPTVYEGTVYIGTGFSDGGALHAIDADSGIQEWSFSTPSGVYSSPTAVNDTVYVGYGFSSDNDGAGAIALDADSGDLEWAFTEPSEAVHSSPTVYDGTVYVGTRPGSLYALDADTGNKRWRFDTAGGVDSSPTVHDGIVYVGSLGADDTEDASLYAIDASSGFKEWSYVVDESDAFFFSSPTVANGMVYVGTHGSGGEDSELYAFDAKTGTQDWVYNVGEQKIYSSPTVYDGSVYIGTGFFSNSGTFYAFDADTGIVEWKNEASWSFESSPTVVAEPDGGHSVGSRVLLRTLGHHDVDTSESAGPFTVSDLKLDSADVSPGETISVSAAITNEGDAVGTATVESTIKGDTVATQTVELNAGTTTNIVQGLTAPTEPGSYTYAVVTGDDAESGTLTVQDDTGIEGDRIIAQQQLTPGGSTTVELAVTTDSATDIEIIEQFDPAVGSVEFVDSDGASFQGTSPDELFATYDDRSTVTLVYEVHIHGDAAAGDTYELSSGPSGGVDAGTDTIEIVDQWWGPYTNNEGVATSASQILDAIGDFKNGELTASQIFTLIQSFETGKPVPELTG